MNALIAEVIGTMLLIYLGNGVVANVVLAKTKGHNGGWIVITLGWGLAVYVAVLVAGPHSGAHINPAITLGLAAIGQFDWSLVLPYISAQMLGAALGSFLVWVSYFDHFQQTENVDLKLACHCTAPAIRKPFLNMVSELLGTFVLMFTVLYIVGPSFSADGLPNAQIGLGSLGALPVALLVTAIGLSLGGTTGYAINPARDLAPRIMHTFLPLGDKRDSDWGYAWVPIVGPLLGTLLAAGLFQIL